MPRYFFHTADGRYFADNEGTEFSGLEAARDAALKFHGEMIKCLSDFWEAGEFRVIVKDVAGETLFSLVTSAVVGPDASRG